MKLIFTYKNVRAHVNEIDLRCFASIEGCESNWQLPYNKYFCSWLSCDVDTTQSCSSILAQIEQLERGEKELAYGGGNAWFVTIYRDHADFELQSENEHPDWPIWKCSLAEVKTALIGWRKFLKMPKRLDSAMEIELSPSPA